MKLHSHVHVFKEFFIYQYLIVDDTEIAFIDIGLKGNHKKLVRQLEKLRINSKTIERIMITHADADHYGGAAEMASLSGAKICAGQIEARAMLVGGSSRILTPRGVERVVYWITGHLFRADPIEVNMIMSPGEVLPLLGGLQVLDTSGHTPGHISYFSPSTRILFAGDSIDLMSGKPKPSHGANTWDKLLAKLSFEKQMDLRPRLICAGHGYFFMD